MQDAPHPAEEEILRQVQWIRGLAFAILRDFELAQDVSQDVLLRALSGEPRQGRVLRAWLAAVTRNRSRTVLRDRRRLSAREKEAARPEATPPARDPIEALEAHHALTRAIHGLPAEAKAIVLLRYFEDLGFPDIADRLQITENAARVRLHRALAQLRSALERRGGDWKSYCLQALPAGTLALPGALETLGGLLVMKGSKSIAFTLLALLLLAAGAFLWQDRAGPTPPTLPGGASLASAPAAAATDAESPEPDLQREEVNAADPAHTWILRGQAQLAGGAHASGVLLHAVLHDGYDAECPILIEKDLRTGADGKFSWSLPPPGRPIFLTLNSSESRAHEGDQRLVLARDPPPQDLKVTVRRYGVLVRGTVRNEALEPIAGAEVFGGREPVASDAAGAFELLGPLGRETIPVHAQAPGYAQASLRVTPVPDQAVQADFVLTREFALRGRVVDEEGAPLGGVSFKADRTMPTPVLSQADGTYYLGHLSPLVREYFVTASKDGYCMASERVAVENRSLCEVNFVLKRGVRVEGRVTGPTGEALDGALLYVGFSPLAYNRVDAVAHGDGAYAFPNVPTGKQTVHVQYRGMAPAWRALELPENAELLTGVDFQLEAGHFAGGQVVDEEGAPLAEAVVSLVLDGEDFRQRVTTDQDGRFRLEGLPATGVGLLCQRDGFLRLEMPLESLDRDDLTLRMTACGQLAGRVLDDATGLPLDSFIIRFDSFIVDLQPGETPAYGYGGDWMEEGRRFEGTGGEWLSGPDLEVGTILGIEASAPGYGAVRAERVVVPRVPNPEALVIRLRPSAIVRGRVQDAQGIGQQRATITVLRPEDLSEHRMFDPSRRPMVLTDADGNFLLTEVPAGVVHLHVAHADFVTSLLGPLELASGDQNPPLTIVMESGSALRGVVRGPDGAGLAGAVLELYAQSGSAPRNDGVQTRADALGRFEYSHVAPGRYQIIASRLVGSRRQGYLSLSLTVVAGEASEVVLQTGGSARIQGRITADEALPPIQGVTLHWVPDAAAEAAGAALMLWQTAEVVDGAFEFASVAPGRYFLSCDAYDAAEKAFFTGGQALTLEEGQTFESLLHLKREFNR